jgi:acyl-homoserine-lactone acylase
VFPVSGIPVLNGSRSACRWESDADAVVPGIFGPHEIPRLFRRDYVHNGNDSHWLINPAHPLTGYERVIGDEVTPRSLRTRLGLEMVRQRLAGTDRLRGHRFTLRRLARVALGNRQYAGELWRDELVAFCEQHPSLSGSSGPVDVSGACPVLAAWNLRNELNAPGAVLFQRFAANLLANFRYLPTGVSSGQNTGEATVYDTPFNPANPVDTPNGLDTSNPLVGRALADAVSDLRGAGIPLDGTLGDYQYDVRGGERVPIHGGPGTLGIFNAINSTWRRGEGYTNVPHGASFIAAIAFRNQGCPVRALTFVTHGQSENPDSPHAADYTRAFSRKRWNRVPFCRAELRRKTLALERVSTGRRR